MATCKMCGKSFDEKDVERFIDSEFGAGEYHHVSYECFGGPLCRDCAVSIHYANQDAEEEAEANSTHESDQ